MLSFCLSSHKIPLPYAKWEWDHGPVTWAVVPEGTWEEHDSRHLPSRRLIYWEREMWSDRNLVEKVLWREISIREGIPEEEELAASWENGVGGCLLVSPLSGKPLKGRESVLSLSPMSLKANMPYPKQGDCNAFHFSKKATQSGRKCTRLVILTLQFLAIGEIIYHFWLLVFTSVKLEKQQYHCFW